MEFEILFWKVYKNTYLVNKIFKYIEIVQWEDHVHIDNRKKFKDIISMEWMIEKELYQLLKCKILANEYIEINKNSIIKLQESTFNSKNELLKLLFEKKKFEMYLYVESYNELTNEIKYYNENEVIQEQDDAEMNNNETQDTTNNEKYENFIKSIKEFNFENYQAIIDFDIQDVKIDFSFINNYSSDEIIKLLNQINSIDGFFKSRKIFSSFIKEIASKFSNDEEIKINLNLYRIYSSYLLIESIEIIEIKTIKFILNNFKKNEELKLEIIEFERGFKNHLFDKYGKACRVVLSNGVSILELIECIKFVYSDFIKSNANMVCNSLYSKIINGLFDALISINGLTVSQLKSTYELICPEFVYNEAPEFIKEHSIYHSFFYLSIKFPTIFNFILEIPYLTKILIELGHKEFNANASYPSIGHFNLSKYLDSNKYSYNYIFGNGTFRNKDGISFDQCLNEIINDIPRKLISKASSLISKNHIIYETENHNLKFFLKIKKIDWFFKELELINISNSNNVNEKCLKYSFSVLQLALHVLNEDELLKFINNYLISPNSMFYLNNSLISLLIEYSPNKLNEIKLCLNNIPIDDRKGGWDVDTIFEKNQNFIIIKTLISIQYQPFINYINENYSNILNNLLSNGFIELLNLIKSIQLPQHQSFKFSRSSILNLINSKKLNLLKHFIEVYSPFDQDELDFINKQIN